MTKMRAFYALLTAGTATLVACQEANHLIGPDDRANNLETQPELGATIVFTKLSESQDQDENVVAEIYVMNADGSDQRRVTTNLLFDIGANLSPNGKTIAFHQGSLTGPCCTINLVETDGSNERVIAGGMFPSWSPDGKQILFHSSGAGGLGDIWVINVDGTGLTNLTNTLSGESRADWSPSGRQIVFQSNRSGNADIWIMDVDGSNVVQITNDPAQDAAPDWSPDGREIVFQSNRDDARMDLYVVNVDGTNVRRLTFGGGRDLDAAWSVDGRQIVFDSDRDAIAEQIRQVFVMNADGTDQRPVTTLPSENGHPGWGAGRAVAR